MSLNWDHQLLTMSINDVVTELARTNSPDYKQQLLDKYFWLSRQAKFNVDAIAADWKVFDWDRAHELGWFCPADYTYFFQLEKYKNEALKNYPNLLNNNQLKSEPIEVYVKQPRMFTILGFIVLALLSLTGFVALIAETSF